MVVGRNKLRNMDFNEDEDDDPFSNKKFLKKRKKGKMRWKNRRPKKQFKY